MRTPRRRQTKPESSDCSGEVGARLAAARRFKGVSQAALAGKILMTRASLANVESGRTALTAFCGWRACWMALNIHPDWLCFGTKAQEPFPVLPDVVFHWIEAQFQEMATARFTAVWEALGPFAEASRTMPDATVVDVVAKVVRRQRESAVARMAKIGLSGRDQQTSDVHLTNQASSLEVAALKLLLPSLLERLRRATTRHGSKTDLAAWLGVHRQTVTDWLSGKQQPGGEAALRILNWVEDWERKNP